MAKEETAKEKTKEKEKEKTKYRVLCWGACTPDSPCSFEYAVGTARKSARTGDIVDDLPPSVVGRPGQEGFRDLILGVHIEEVE